jgi:hypothetical protein
VGARGEVASFASGYPVAALILHGREASHVEASAKRTAFAGQYHRSHAFFAGEPVGSTDKCIEHRGIESVHLVRPHQTNIGNSIRNRYRDAIIHR